MLFVFLRVAFCFQDLFRSSHLRAVFLLRVASFFGFPAACVLLIFAPSTHTRTCLWTCFLRVFAFLFAIMIVARMVAMVAWNACHLLSVIAHAVCSRDGPSGCFIGVGLVVVVVLGIMLAVRLVVVAFALAAAEKMQAPSSFMLVSGVSSQREMCLVGMGPAGALLNECTAALAAGRT